MTLDTQECRTIAGLLAGLQQTISFSNPILNSRHAQILSKLRSLESFFLRLASMAEQTEYSIQRTIAPVSSMPGVHYSGGTSGTLRGLQRGRAIKIYGNAGYTLGACSYGYSGSLASGTLAMSFLDLSGSTSASFYAFSKGNFYPRLVLSADASARLAAGSVEGRVGNDVLSISASASGEAGVVYGQAKAVLSLDEQVLSAQVGAAALRGECTACFEVLGVDVSVSASGSIGSFEAGFSYENVPGQWAIEANGALFAGGGLRFQINY